MKLLGINGSPRPGGNTEILLAKALEGARSRGAAVEKVVLNALTFVPCQECERLRDNGGCVVEDDMQRVYGKVKEADALLLGSPIFFGSLSAQTKMMIDRFQCLWRAKYVLKLDVFKRQRPGGFISVEAGRREDFFQNAKAIVRNFFATINVEYKGELFVRGVDEKGSVLKHPGALKKAFELGVRLVAT